MSTLIQPEQYVKEYLSIGDFLNGRTDRQAFDAAITAAPAGKKCYIRIPYRTAPYILGAGYLQTGNRNIQWLVDDGVDFNPSSDWPKLHGKVITSSAILNPGRGIRDDNTGMTIKVSGAALAGNRGSGITGHTSPAHRAYNHERGRAGMYVEVTDSGEVSVASATFTATSFTPVTPVSPNQLAVGMYADVVGPILDSSNPATIRFSGMITGWEADGSVIYVDGWWRATSYEAAVEQTPPNGRRVVINPTTKIWSGNLNLFVGKPDGNANGYTSVGGWEWGFINNSGVDYKNHFDRNNTGLYPHAYIADFALVSGPTGNGGGIPIMIRGHHKKWWQGVCIQNAETGVHMDSGALNEGSVALQSSNDADGGPETLLRARSFISGIWDAMFEVSSKLPRMHIGRSTIASFPELRFKSSGLAANYDSRITASGGNGTDGQGTMRLHCPSTFVTFPGPYANDAAAAAASVQVGEAYRQTGGAVVWRQA